MTPLEVALLGVSALFAVNMGGSGLAPAFSVALGARLIERRPAILLFTAFVVLGALTLGGFVARTLGTGLVSPGTLDHRSALVVLASATGALLVANLLRIPQSTSWVTVFSIAVVGLLHGDLNTDTILHRLLPAWLLLPALSFALTAGALRLLYPLTPRNVRLHEHLTRHERTLRALVLGSSCYVATAIGSNNVANVVGPLVAARATETVPAFCLFAPVFGLGAVLLRGPADTVGTRIVPLGLVTATVTNLVVGTVLLAASWWGIPQSLVQLNAGAVVGVLLVKDGFHRGVRHGTLRQMVRLWFVTPLLASGATFVALRGLG
jgi:sulfate permease